MENHNHATSWMHDYGYNFSLSIEDQWQCIKCKLIQSKLSAICDLCGRNNQYLCDENLKLIHCDKRQSPMFCTDDKINCAGCTKKVKLNAIIWECIGSTKSIICDRCYMMKWYQLTPISIETCDLSTCPNLKRFVLCMNRYSNYDDDDNMYRAELETDCKFTSDYLHLVEEHKSKQEFEYVVNCLDECDITKCQSYIGPNKDRNGLSSIEIEKMHCHFQHRHGYISGEESAVLGVNINGCIVCGKQSKYEEILWHCNGSTVCDNCYDIVQQSRGVCHNECKSINCYCWKRFIIEMNRYNEYNKQDINYCNYENITRILNAYLHLIHGHNDDENFECIMSALSQCELSRKMYRIFKK